MFAQRGRPCLVTGQRQGDCLSSLLITSSSCWLPSSHTSFSQLSKGAKLFNPLQLPGMPVCPWLPGPSACEILFFLEVSAHWSHPCTVLSWCPYLKKVLLLKLCCNVLHFSFIAFTKFRQICISCISHVHTHTLYRKQHICLMYVSALQGKLCTRYHVCVFHSSLLLWTVLETW